MSRRYGGGSDFGSRPISSPGYHESPGSSRGGWWDAGNGGYDEPPRRPDYQELNAPGNSNETPSTTYETLFVQKYFALFKQTPKIDYLERKAGFVAVVNLPLPPQIPSGTVTTISVESMGRSKKDARAGLVRAVKERVEVSGLMSAAEAWAATSKKKQQQSGGRGAKAPQQKPGTDYVPDSWDERGVKALPVERGPVKVLKNNTTVPANRGPAIVEPQPPADWEDNVDWWDERPIQQPDRQNASSAERGATTNGPPRSNVQHHHRHNHDSRNNRPPVPHSSTRLPQSIDDAVRKFVNFYCGKVKVEVPSPHITQDRVSTPSGGRGGSRSKVVTGDWIARITVPAHTTVDGKEVEAVLGLGRGRAKKDTVPNAWEDLCSRLLVLSPQSLVDQFISLATPLKRRIADMLAEPVRVDIPDTALDRLEDLIANLRKSKAFEISASEAPKTGVQSVSSALASAASNKMNLRGLGRPIVQPSSLPPPPELSRSADLPMYSCYSTVMAAIENNPVTILCAETGAGKTTQLPQFILAHEKAMRAKDPSRPAARIICTQPRRIAAISVAQRVASERGEVCGRDSAIGYQVRFDEKRPTTDVQVTGHAVFCTSGILLRRFQVDPLLSNVTHVILDEVHERDLNTDLLLIITRQLLQNRPDIKLILMSATAETSLFAEYFRGFGTDPATGFLPPIVNVPGRLYPVAEYYLEDMVDIAKSVVRANLSPDTHKFIRNELGGAPLPSNNSSRYIQEDVLPLDLLETIIAYITTSLPPGAILVFLPGWQEINQLQSKLKDEDNFRVGFGDPRIAKVLPLHSSIPQQGQQEVFDVPPQGVRKIILSTNIAETSVTINDIVYVVDSGKIRINSYDANSRISSLNSVWGAQSNIKQRCGRAGRCQPGQYFSLLSRRRRGELAYSMPPELLRVDLQSTALKVKALQIGSSIGAVLSQAPQAPHRSSIERALDELRSLGALDAGENLTPLGQVMADMPVDPWIAKMVLQGAVYGCLDPILTVAGTMEIGRGIYSIHPDEKLRGRSHILVNFAPGTESDQLTMLEAYRQWKRSGQSRDFAFSNFLHFASLLNVDRAKGQLLRVLEDGGFLSRRSVAKGFATRQDEPVDLSVLGGAEANVHAGDLAVVRAILCASLFPNIAEVAAKDEYRSITDFKLRLTSSSVNSYRGLMVSSGMAEPSVAVKNNSGGDNLSRNNSRPSSSMGSYSAAVPSSSSSDIADDGFAVAADETDDLDQDDLQGAPLPPRLLCYQDKQRVDGALYLRSTSRADPLALLLLSPSSGEAGDISQQPGKMLSLKWTSVNGRPAAVLGGWLRVQVLDQQRARVVEEIRAWLNRYLDWLVWSRALRKSSTALDEKKDEGWERLGKQLIGEVAALIRGDHSQ